MSPWRADSLLAALLVCCAGACVDDERGPDDTTNGTGETSSAAGGTSGSSIAADGASGSSGRSGTPGSSGASGRIDGAAPPVASDDAGPEVFVPLDGPSLPDGTSAAEDDATMPADGARDSSAAGTSGSSGDADGGPVDRGDGASDAGTSSGCVPARCGTHKWACWPMPNPASSGLPNPAHYTDLGNGIVRDDVTCLEWEKSPVSLPTGQDTWTDSLSACESLRIGGHADWRLPTRVEMASLVDFVRPPVDRTAFPGAASGFHHTSSDWILTIRQVGAGRGKDFAWAFNLSDGIASNAYSKARGARHRCVRGNGTGEAPSAPAVAPPDHYATVAPGEIEDRYTHLVWQQGQSPSTMTWVEAKTYCDGLGLNGHSFRLPSIRELATLVDEARVAPAIDVQQFPGTKYGARSDNWYWASHPAANRPTAAWALNFDDGFTGFNAGTGTAWNAFGAAWVRCVR